MVLSSWQSHCENSPGSFDECRAKRPPTQDQARRETTVQAARNYTHHRHLLLLLTPKADTRLPSHRG